MSIAATGCTQLNVTYLGTTHTMSCSEPMTFLAPIENGTLTFGAFNQTATAPYFTAMFVEFETTLTATIYNISL